MGEAHPQSVLLVEDDEVFRTRLARALEGRGMQVQQAESGEQAIALADVESPELALVDLRLPTMDGLEVVRALHAIDPATRIVVLTGYGSIASALDAVRVGATHYLTKPAGVDEILKAFARPNAEEAAQIQGEPEHQQPGEHPEYTPASLARVEWEHINRVLSDCGGNITRAAKMLGIHRRSLQRKLAKYPPRQ